MKMAAMNTAEETWTGMRREPAQARATFAMSLHRRAQRSQYQIFGDGIFEI